MGGSALKAAWRILGALGKRPLSLFLLLLRSPYAILSTGMYASLLMGGFAAMQTGDAAGLSQCLGLFLITVLFLYAYNGGLWRITSAHYVKRLKALKLLLMNRLLDMDLAEMDMYAAGDVSTRLQTDTRLAGDLWFGNMHVPQILQAVLSITLATLILWRMDQRVCLLIWAATLPHLAANLLMGRQVKAVAAQARTRASENAADMLTLMEGSVTARLYGAEAWLLARFERSCRAMEREQMRMAARHVWQNIIMRFFGQGGYLMLLFMGSLWIARGEMGLEALMAMLQYRSGLVAGIMLLTAGLLSMRAQSASVTRVEEVLGKHGDL